MEYFLFFKVVHRSRYNIGGGTELTNMQLSRVILDAFDKSESEIELVPDRLGHDFRYAVDYSKISKETGYKSLIPWGSGIVETINWYKEMKIGGGHSCYEMVDFRR